jgi:HK97 gp10 family phage protein
MAYSGKTSARSSGGGRAVTDFAIRIDGLRDLRKNLRDIDRKMGLEVNRYLRQFTAKVRDEARAAAPFSSGALRKSIKHSVKAKQVSIFSDSPYANAHEWGSIGGTKGRVRPQGVPIKIRKRQMIGHAVYSNVDKFEDHVMGLVDHIARTNGFDD